MRAIVREKYGSPDVLELREIAKPSPKDDEVLVRVHATSLNAADSYLLRGKPFLIRLFGSGLLRPKNPILGSDLAGRVEAVGSTVKQFQPNDEVFGNERGGLGEFACVHERALVSKPANVSFESAAAAPLAASTALQALRDKGAIRQGERVLIVGASGGVGTFAVQIAKSFGAEVTAVCSTANSDAARSSGADHVIDYRQQDFTQSSERYDLILVVNGHRPLSAYKRALGPAGRCVLVGGDSIAQLLGGRLVWPLVRGGRGKRLQGLFAKTNPADLGVLRELLQAGKIRPVIDRRYPLDRAADAFRYLEEGHAHGKLVVSMGQSG